MEKTDTAKKPELRVVNIGLQRFYDALVLQDVCVTQLNWRPPVEQSAEMQSLLDDFL